MQENPSSGGFDNVLRSFLLKPEPKSPPSATRYRVADLYSGTGELSTAVRDAGLDVVYQHDPDDNGKLNFDNIPDFDFLTANMPDTDERRKDALALALRFLRVRRPWAFVFAGEERDGDSEFLWHVQDKTWRLGYEINRTNTGNGLSLVIGMLGQDLPTPSGDPLRESLIERLVRLCAEIRRGREE